MWQVSKPCMFDRDPGSAQVWAPAPSAPRRGGAYRSLKNLGLNCDLFHAWVGGLARKADDFGLGRAADTIDSVFW